MKKTIFLLFLAACMLRTAAQEHKPQLLMGPENWEFERFPLPPSFAPPITYKGAEELRFAPGMFDKDSANYFSYAFVAELENVTGLIKADIQKYLLDYYKGLCFVTARDRKLKVDTSLIRVSIGEPNGNDPVYPANLDIYGVFADGAPVKLLGEVKLLEDKRLSRTYLVIIVSTKSKEDPIWKKLHEIQTSFKIPGHH